MGKDDIMIGRSYHISSIGISKNDATVVIVLLHQGVHPCFCARHDFLLRHARNVEISGENHFPIDFRNGTYQILAVSIILCKKT